MDEDQPLASSNEAPALPPRRRLRLRLRVLLLLLISLCVVVGGWQIYSVYVAPHVEAAGPAVEGKPLVIHGGYVEFLGFDHETIAVDVSRVHPDGQRVMNQSATGRANRHGLWSYDFEIELDPITESGEYDIEVRPMTRAVHSRRQYIDADSIWGKLIVLPRPAS